MLSSSSHEATLPVHLFAFLACANCCYQMPKNCKFFAALCHKLEHGACECLYAECLAIQECITWPVKKDIWLTLAMFCRACGAVERRAACRLCAHSAALRW